jgi:hypothetical protein
MSGWWLDVPDDEKPDQEPIIDLGALGFMPNTADMARSRLASAQHRLGLSNEEFAAALNRMVDWDVTPEAVELWTTIRTPPGDILMAADLLVQYGSRGTDDESLGSSGADVVQELVAERFADLAGVYSSRAALLSALPATALFEGAHDISISGLSLNMICQQYPDRHLQKLIEGGTTVRCLFLAPYGASVQEREREEGYKHGVLSGLTETNMMILSRFRSHLPDEAQPRLRLRTYDAVCRCARCPWLC